MKENSTTNSRRGFLLKTALFTAGIGFANLGLLSAQKNTPSLPHFRNIDEFETDLRKSVISRSNPLIVKGKVFDSNQKPIRKATVSLWHNDSNGKFHPKKFRGKQLIEDKYHFETYKPGKYIIQKGHKATSRIFIMVEAKGYKTQVATLYLNSRNDIFIDGETYAQFSNNQKLPIAKTFLGETIIEFNICLAEEGIFA